MRLRARHLQDERLFDCYLTERAGDPVDPRVTGHLERCTACAGRYAELAAMMDGLAEQAAAEADAVFTPERLRRQQQHIARRIEPIGHPARVLSFPSSFSTRRMPRPASHRPQRWIAAAAAAGLFVGVALGVSFDWERRPKPASTSTARAGALNASRTVPAIPGAMNGGAAPVEPAADDAFLSDLELVRERPRTRELLAFDTFTPRVREISNVR